MARGDHFHCETCGLDWEGETAEDAAEAHDLIEDHPFKLAD